MSFKNVFIIAISFAYDRDQTIINTILRSLSAKKNKKIKCLDFKSKFA